MRGRRGGRGYPCWPRRRRRRSAHRAVIDRYGPDTSRGSLQQLKDAARTCDATVNDVLLTVTAGGLRVLPRSRGEPVDSVVVRIYVPVSTHQESGARARGIRCPSGFQSQSQDCRDQPGDGPAEDENPAVARHAAPRYRQPRSLAVGDLRPRLTSLWPLGQQFALGPDLLDLGCRLVHSVQRYGSDRRGA